MRQPMNVTGDEKLVRQPGTKYVVGPVRHPTLQQEILILQIKHGNLTRRTVNRAKVDAGHEQQCVRRVKLRELRVLPVELLHVVAVPFGHRVSRVPHLKECKGLEKFVKKI